ncbi:hypothetical protein EVG20_g11169, partial [Dentipellis fragilis]
MRPSRRVLSSFKLPPVVVPTARPCPRLCPSTHLTSPQLQLAAMPRRAKRPSLPSLTDASSSSSSSSLPPPPIDEQQQQHQSKADEEHPHWPPTDPREENAAEKQTRLECERAAKAVSDEIDRAIEHDRQERKKLTSEVK